MKTFLFAALLSLGLAGALPAQATVVTYTLQDVTFVDGAAATGSFTLDTTADTVSAVSITMTATPSGTLSFTTGFYNTGQYPYDGLDSVSFADAAPGDVLAVYVDGHFTTQPGNQPLVQDSSDGSATFYCTPNCDSNLVGLSSDTAAALATSLAASPVPEPTSMLLLGGALATLGAVRRRR